MDEQALALQIAKLAFPKMDLNTVRVIKTPNRIRSLQLPVADGYGFAALSIDIAKFVVSINVGWDEKTNTLVLGESASSFLED